MPKKSNKSMIVLDFANSKDIYAKQIEAIET